MEKGNMKAAIVAGLVLAAAVAANAADDVPGLQLAATGIDQVSNTSNKLFALIVQISSWLLALGAFGVTYLFNGKLKTKMEQQQGSEDSSAFMLWVKTAGVFFVSIIAVGMIVFLVWGKIIPIKGSGAQYGDVVIAAFTGNLDQISSSGVADIGNN